MIGMVLSLAGLALVVASIFIDDDGKSKAFSILGVTVALFVVLVAFGAL